MFSLSHLQTLRAQVTSDGVICLMALYIEDEQSEARLANICGRSVKHMRTVVFPLLHLHAYAETVSVFLKITSKAREIISKIGSTFATLFGIQATALSAVSATPDTAQAELPNLVSEAETGGKVFHALSFIQDQNSDQSLDQDQESRVSERNADEAPRDLQAIVAWLDQHHVVDPINGKRKYRSLILANPWCTLDRLNAALERARLNPNRLSDNYVGLALHELTDPKRTHYTEIDAMVKVIKAQTMQESAAKERDAVQVEAPDLIEAARKHYPINSWKEWSYIQEEIANFDIKEHNLKLAWKTLYPTSHDDTHLSLVLPDSAWLVKVQRYTDTIQRMLYRDTGHHYTVEFLTI